MAAGCPALAQSVTFNGDLSEIEIALLDQIALLILSEWCQLWQKVESPHPMILGHESSGRFLNTSPHDSILLILSIEVRLGDCAEQMQLAFPFLTIEPLVRSAAAGEADRGGAAEPAAPSWNPSLDEVRIRVDTEWHDIELTAGQLAALKCGDVLMLDRSCLDRVGVRFEERPKFHGRLGTSGNRLAVELTAPLET